MLMLPYALNAGASRSLLVKLAYGAFLYSTQKSCGRTELPLVASRSLNPLRISSLISRKTSSRDQARGNCLNSPRSQVFFWQRPDHPSGRILQIGTSRRRIPITMSCPPILIVESPVLPSFRIFFKAPLSECYVGSRSYRA